jgi:hypothetical protein
MGPTVPGLCVNFAGMDGHPARNPAPRSLRRAVGTALALVALGGGLAACSDDEVPVASEDAYAESIVAACDRQMPTLLEAWDDLRDSPFSDAELRAFYISEMVPRQRSILRSVSSAGLPNVQEVHEGINDAAIALQEIEDDAAALIDRRRDGTFLEDENPWINLSAALDSAGIECAMEPNNWEP